METRVTAVICTSAEVVIPWSDPTGNGNHDECREVAGAAVRAAIDEWGIELVREDPWFPNWNGGKFSHHAKLFGWERTAFGVVRAEVLIERDEESGEETWEQRPYETLPQVAEAVARVEAAHEEAFARVRRQAEED